MPDIEPKIYVLYKYLTPLILNKMNRRTLWKADNFRYLYGNENDTLHTRFIFVRSIRDGETFTRLVTRNTGNRARFTDRSR